MVSWCFFDAAASDSGLSSTVVVRDNLRQPELMRHVCGRLAP